MARLSPYFPKSHGKPRVDDQRVLSGISFASFKPIGDGTNRRLALTAMYRNHYYIEKLLGNLIGLGRLMAFVAAEAGIAPGPLTILSTHATIDTDKWNRTDIKALLAACDQANAQVEVAA